MTRWHFHTLAPLVAVAVSAPLQLYAWGGRRAGLLAVPPADVAFDNVHMHAAAVAVSKTIRAAIEAQDAAAIRAIETRDAGKWKD